MKEVDIFHFDNESECYAVAQLKLYGCNDSTDAQVVIARKGAIDLIPGSTVLTLSYYKMSFPVPFFDN